MRSQSFRLRVFAVLGSACVAGGLAAGCGGAQGKAPPPLDAVKAKQANEDEYKAAMEQVDADPSLTAEDKQMVKSQLEHGMKMQSNTIDGLDRAQKGLDPGGAGNVRQP